jgi:hypothetical protein
MEMEKEAIFIPATAYYTPQSCEMQRLGNSLYLIIRAPDSLLSKCEERQCQPGNQKFFFWAVYGGSRVKVVRAGGDGE